MKLRKQFDGHTHGIGCIAWCPFSRFIIVCGTDDCNEIWIWDIEVCVHFDFVSLPFVNINQNHIFIYLEK